LPNAIQFWLSFNNGAERLQLPVNPASIRIQSDYGWEDVTITQLGEYSIPSDAKLRGFSLSSFFPRDYNPSYCEYEAIPSPWSAVETIDAWAKSRRPVRLTVTGTPINYAVTIRSFNQESERAGNPGDIYYELTLKEYVFVTTNAVQMTEDAAKVKNVPDRQDSREIPKTYTVAPGDNLTKIALRYGLQTRDLYAKNKGTVGPDPNRIFPGQVLALA